MPLPASFQGLEHDPSPIAGVPTRTSGRCSSPASEAGTIAGRPPPLASSPDALAVLLRAPHASQHENLHASSHASSHTSPQNPLAPCPSPVNAESGSRDGTETSGAAWTSGAATATSAAWTSGVVSETTETGFVPHGPATDDAAVETRSSDSGLADAPENMQLGAHPHTTPVTALTFLTATTAWTSPADLSSLPSLPALPDDFLAVAESPTDYDLELELVAPVAAANAAAHRADDPIQSTDEKTREQSDLDRSDLNRSDLNRSGSGCSVHPAADVVSSLDQATSVSSVSSVPSPSSSLQPSSSSAASTFEPSFLER